MPATAHNNSYNNLSVLKSRQTVSNQSSQIQILGRIQTDQSDLTETYLFQDHELGTGNKIC